MKIESIEIKNWRSIKQITMELQDLMTLIGQNNHGKSNIISALLFFFGEVKAGEADFKDISLDITVDITFRDLGATEQVTFHKYVTGDNKLKVQKIAFYGGSFEYHGYIQNPVEDWLKEENAGNYTNRADASSLPFAVYLTESGRLTKQSILDAQAEYIRQNSANIQFNYELETSNFLGLKSVAKGMFGEVYFIPAVKEAADDYSSKETSTFGRLYSDIISDMSKSNPEWSATRSKLLGLFRALNKFDETGEPNIQRPQELTHLEAKLSSELATWGAEVDVEVLAPDIEDVFRANTQVWVDDGTRTDIRRKGHGLQRALIFALIKVMADNQKAEKAQTLLEAAGKRSSSNSTYFFLEEPELYLHPQAQRALLDSLVKLSLGDSQVIFCTHSSSLIDIERYKSICIIKKESEVDGTQVHQCLESVISGDQKKDFNLAYWINPDRGELFFARRVVLLEGQTEKVLIPLLADRLGFFKHDVTLVDCGSKDNIPLYVTLLNKFGISYVAVYDKDHQLTKSQDGWASADKSSCNIETAIDQSFGTSIVFVNDIEEEIGLVAGDKNKPYVAASRVADPSFIIQNCLIEKIKAIYR